MKPVLLIAIAAFLLGGSSLFAKPVDLSRFAGKYPGTVSFATGGAPFSGSSRMVFKVAKNGTRANLAVNASFNALGTFYDASNKFAFAKNKTMAAAALMPPFALVPANGVYSVKKGVTIDGTVFYPLGGITYSSTLVVRVKKTSERATLTAVYTLFANGVQGYQITYSGIRKLKK